MSPNSLDMKITCDTRELDAALDKLKEVMRLSTEAQQAGVLPAAAIVTTIAASAGTKVSRRGLLGLGWLRGR